MNVFDKVRLEMRLREIGNRMYTLACAVMQFNMADEEIRNLAINEPNRYNHLVKLAEEEFTLSVEEANIFLQLERYEDYEQMTRYQIPTIEKSLWTIKQAAA